MSSKKRTKSGAEESAIDDVRRIRQRLQHESGGSIRKHVEQSNRAAEKYVAKLGLKQVDASARKPRRTKTG